ncbi:hypothetical protein CDD83_2208 [Cordyceps sp. RAO-2017]|nr:hypothetical protein CDD83_2208 [Cordyceps sp. RAO-2017]
MDLDVSLLYLITFFGIACLALILWTLKLLIRNPAIYYARYVRYPLLVNFRWLRATRLESAMFIVFLLINFGAILIPSFFPGWRQVQTRAALMAIVNTAPLCMGGRAPIVDALNIPRNWYLMLHSWIGVVAITEAATHSIIALSLRPRPGSLTQTGWANVILSAKGMGIVGILPLALHLALRRKHDDRIRDRMQQISVEDMDLWKQAKDSSGNSDLLTRRRSTLAEERAGLSREYLNRDSAKKVIIFWSLEANSQMEWVKDQVKSLQNLDPANKLLIMWCGYPRPREGFKPFKDSRFWMCLDTGAVLSFDELIVSKIKEERARLPGNMGVIVCGDWSFCNKMRKGTIDSMKGSSISFMETEYHPRRIGSQDIKMEQLAGRFNDRGRLRRRKNDEEEELRDMANHLSDARTYSVVSSLYSEAA